MSQYAFCKTFNEYKKLYVEKKYDACIQLFPKMDLKANYSQYREPVEFVIRSACHSLSTITNVRVKDKVAVANGFATVFGCCGNTDSYTNLLKMVYWFTSMKDLERYLPFFTELKPSQFDLGSWLQTATANLFQSMNLANASDNLNQTKQRDTYLQLSHVLLFMVNAEAQRAGYLKNSWEFNESIRFLKNCTEFKLFREGDQQYNECFKMLNQFLVCIYSDKSVTLNESLQKFIKKLKEMIKSNKLRATLVQDCFIILAKLIKICEQRFNQMIDSKNFGVFIDLIGYITNGANQSKTEKSFCSHCTNTGHHLSHDLTLLVVNTFSRLINEKHESDTADKIGNIIRIDLEIVSKMVCSKLSILQQESVYTFRTLMKNCETKVTAELMIPILKSVLKRYHKLKLDHSKLDACMLLNYLFNAFNTLEKWNELIDVGYLELAFITVVESMPNFDHMAWTLANKQKEIQGNISQKSPFDHFSEIKAESLYGLKLPDQFNLTKLSLAYLRVGMRYSCMSTELSNKIVHQLLMRATSNEFTALRFVFYVNSIVFDRMTIERIETLTKTLQNKSNNDVSIELQLAAIKYYQLNHEATEWSEEYQNISISESLKEENLVLSTNIFKKLTFDREKAQIIALRDVKKKFINFAEFYLNRSTEERKSFEDEKDLLLRDLKMIANQFIVRGYIGDGFDLFMVLYRLAIEVNDDLGIIDSCSFFAEHCADFKRTFPNENLSTIIEKCFKCVIGKLKELKKISSRKQNQVCFCMLNLVLFYHEDDGDHKREIYMIMGYIFKTIGGVGDKELSDSMDAVLRFHVNSDKNDTQIIHSEAVRIKFYSVLFTIVTKYEAPCTFDPAIFIQFVLQHVKKYIGVYYDATASVPILLYNMIPQMIIWLFSVYEVHSNHISLIQTLLKLAIRSGYALRTANLMVTILHMKLMTESLKEIKPYFKALDGVVQSQHSNDTVNQSKLDVGFSVTEVGTLCEPIRKRGVVVSPVKKMPSSPTTEELQANANKYLLMHADACDCGLCYNPENKLAMFGIAVAFARYAYIDDTEFNPEMKRIIFNQLHAYWDKNYKNKAKFPRSDLFYVTSARMLMYYGHYTWKFEPESRSKAVDLLKRGLKGMEKVKYGACRIKQDLTYRVKEMEDTIQMQNVPREQRFGGMWILNKKKTYADEPKTQTEPIKKPKVPAKKTTQAINRIHSNILDLINEQPKASGSFQIHADGEGSASATPITSKSTRGRPKFDSEDHTPITRTRTRAQDIGSVSKTVERPKRNNRGINHIVPKIAIDLTESSPESQDSSTKSISSSAKEEQVNGEQGSRKAKSIPIKTTRKNASLADE